MKKPLNIPPPYTRHSKDGGVPPKQTAAWMIHNARTRAVITQTELAKRMGIRQQVISRWEKGLSEPTFDSVLTAVGACGFDVLAALELREDDHDAPHSRARFEMLAWDRNNRFEMTLQKRRAMRDRRAESKRSLEDKLPARETDL